MDGPVELEIKGIKYQLNKLNAFEQWHLFRRCSPMLEAFGIGMLSLPAEVINGDDGSLTADMQMRVFAPVMDVISKLSDAESDYIMHKCLGRVRRSNGSSWVPLMSHGQMMFDDIDMGVLFQLTIQMLQENGILGFTPGDLAPSTQAGVSQSQSTSSNSQMDLTGFSDPSTRASSGTPS